MWKFNHYDSQAKLTKTFLGFFMSFYQRLAICCVPAASRLNSSLAKVLLKLAIATKTPKLKRIVVRVKLKLQGYGP